MTEAKAESDFGIEEVTRKDIAKYAEGDPAVSAVRRRISSPEVRQVTLDDVLREYVESV
jgi:hypothetical protein